MFFYDNFMIFLNENFVIFFMNILCFFIFFKGDVGGKKT